jgi:signal transduction histidine kinase
MENNKLAWLCSELGLAAVVESERGVVANRAAVTAGCEPHPPTLEVALSALLRTQQLTPSVIDAVARARAGEAVATMLSPDGVGQTAFRLVVAPWSPGRAQAVVAPESMAPSLELTRRASLVDVAAAVSHEVANAVGAIAGWAQLASAGASGVSKDEALRLIASCARTAQEAARGMLSLARGERTDEESETALSQLADELLTLLALTARQERVALSGSIEPELSVRGSRAQLFTVLWNLTKNAVEACAPGGQVNVVLRSHGAGKVMLEVHDTGPGLEADDVARIFTPYYTTKPGGTGLGLALVQRTSADLGGEVSVHSLKGRGTTFRVMLPRIIRQSRVTPRESLALSSREVATPASGMAPLPGAPGGHEARLTARILVVDDDDALREMVRTALSLRGAEVVTARNGDEARAAEGHFDIALIDMMLEGTRGDELLAALRRRGGVSAAMLVTGTVQKPRLVPGGEPDDWVRKPFELNQLVERIRRTLQRHQMLSSVSAQMR